MKTRIGAVNCFLISYLVPEISTFKETKHDTLSSLQTTTTAKSMSSLGLHVDHQVIRLTIYR